MYKYSILFICIAFIADAYATSELVSRRHQIICNKPNEEYKACGLLQRCVPTCKDPDGLPCPKICGEGCYCKEGYIRDGKWNCIRKNKCPERICRKNEEWVDCICESTCKNPNLRPSFECQNTCTPGCACQHKFVRDIDGYCVEPNECLEPICKKRREIFTYCGTACPLTCKKPTVEMCTEQCVTGCFCEDGYYRDKHGNCVRPSKCNPPFCKEKYERFTHCSANKDCQATCEFPEGRGCDKRCIFGCKCEDGYVRDENWKCIPKSECPKPECKKNEEWSDCGGNPCAPTCDDIYKPFICRAGCSPGCGCKVGYIRDSNKNCIRPRHCPKPVCPLEENEVYSACNGIKECQPSCKHPDGVICEDRCTPGCKCNKGYIRNDEGKCVPESQCQPVCTKEHEYYTECGTACPLSCDVPYVEVCTLQCVAGCFCEAGYIRDKHGNCIRPRECKPSICKKKYERFTECGGNKDCQATCEFPDGRGCDKRCIFGCKCEDGYVRDAEWNCIPKSKCPKKLLCGPNEEYHKCTAICGEKTCTNREDRYCGRGCKPRCLCKDGYIRNENGVCVKLEECPQPLCSKKNEKYLECGPPSDCELRCDRPVWDTCGDKCVPGCFCENFYYRDQDGNCVVHHECPLPSCIRKNEIWSFCGDYACEATCDDPKKPRNCKEPCKPGCGCKMGYVRDANGNCVEPNRCPVPVCMRKEEIYSSCYTECTKTCNITSTICFPNGECPENMCTMKNEIWSTCADSSCEATCDDPKKPKQCSVQCKPGCACKVGYLRNADGDCVEPNQCPIPICTRSLEIYSSCSISCGNTCDDSIVTCLPNEKCPDDLCKRQNEEWSDCGDNPCAATCKNIYLPFMCKAACKAGCGCKHGYLLDENRNCILPHHCPNPVCPVAKNEVYTECNGIKSCQATCQNPDVTDCYAKCTMGCKCKDGFIRDAQGNCICQSECPQ